MFFSLRLVLVHMGTGAGALPIGALGGRTPPPPPRAGAGGLQHVCTYALVYQSGMAVNTIELSIRSCNYTRIRTSRLPHVAASQACQLAGE
jgi:hypothetical protein